MIYHEFPIKKYRIKRVGEYYHIEEGRWALFLIVPVFIWNYLTLWPSLEDAIADIQQRIKKQSDAENAMVLEEFEVK